MSRKPGEKRENQCYERRKLMTSGEKIEGLWRDIEMIRKESPLVHNITNYVVMNTTANALLSLGASPVMAHALDEVEDMVKIASALVINIGTLSPAWIESMARAAGAAVTKGIPLVLDPVGAGASRMRTETVQRLMRQAPPKILRGNASEIRALYHAEGETKGVESRHSSTAALEAAAEVNRLYQCVVSISGEVDFIVMHGKVSTIGGGHRLMPRVTGLGCTASALTGAFAAINGNYHQAAAHAMAVMAVAGEMAGEKAAGPGTFQVYFLDALHLMTKEDLARRLKWEGG